ncbi:hypothetical protein HY772_03200 [Candidatus Woesearchaeota archaeon]|nr:hypothetical protein [Candidatus Woesearchaeota archaeon]
MRDSTHEEFLVNWANFVHDHPADWKEQHKEFIDAQFQKTSAFIERLRKTKDGDEKIMQAYGIKNMRGYPVLLSRVKP